MEEEGPVRETAEVRGAMMAEEITKRKMKVLVAIDGSEASMHALAWVLDHFFTSTVLGVPDTTERLGTLILVHAQPALHYMMQPVGPAAVYAPSSVIESVKTAQDQNSALVIDKAVQICKERLVEARSMIAEGDPKDMICQAAEQVEADLLVVGSRGLSRIKRAFLGSVSDYVAHHARCPVLIVRSPKSHNKKEDVGGGTSALKCVLTE